MDVTFSGAALAALCNSQRRLIQRWGPEVGRTVARRLLDLAAADAADVARLPGARVSIDGDGETTITFNEAIVVRGTIHNSSDGPPATRSDADCLVITSLGVRQKEQR